MCCRLIEGDNFLTNMQFVPGYHKAATSKLLFALNSFIFPTSFFAVNLWCDRLLHCFCTRLALTRLWLQATYWSN